MYTIHLGEELHLTRHPDGGKVAYLYHHETHAKSHVDQSEAGELQVSEVGDLTLWLESLKTKGIAHVFEALPAEDEKGVPISNMHNVQFRLLFIQLGLEKFD